MLKYGKEKGWSRGGKKRQTNIENKKENEVDEIEENEKKKNVLRT